MLSQIDAHFTPVQKTMATADPAHGGSDETCVISDAAHPVHTGSESNKIIPSNAAVSYPVRQ